ncbi:ScbA/BarX family gamma-butyrolactone biosynthesis protein [Kitasatospora sp. NPDC001540]|uniref:ScbA/BarX family gamma-butyrolactone biosynthesis protein n=1 Tax=Kitasatospora sp. NPDC001540 TaxID=3364014 RepID=UPI00369ABA24
MSDSLFDQPVPRRYVHRAAVSEVMLTAFHQDGPDAFVLAAQWPRGHGFYRTEHGLHDPLLLAETVRQVGLMVGHAGYGVPFENPYIMSGLSYRITPAGLACGSTPTDLVLETGCHDVQRRGGQLAGLTYRMRIHRGMTEIGEASAAFTCVSPAVYRRLRGPAAGAEVRPLPLPTPVAPGLVGRDHPADTALAPTPEGDRWLIRSNLDHPVLFDHPVDHVPGMVIMESMRQAARLVLADPGAVVTGFDVDFLRFVELDAPAELTARVEPGRGGRPLSHDGATAVGVAVEQGGAVVAEGNLLVRGRD